jgi:hypothetical protein
MRTVEQTRNQYEDIKIILRWPISDLVLPQVKEMMGKIIIISWKLGHGSMVPSVSGIMLVRHGWVCVLSHETIKLMT